MYVHTSVDYGDVCEKISAEACSGKEISGLLKMIRKMMMNDNDDTKNREIACELILARPTGGR